MSLLTERPFSDNKSDYLPKDVSSNYVPLGHRFFGNNLLFVIQYISENLNNELYLFSYDTVKNLLIDASKVADVGDGSGVSSELRTRWENDSLLELIQIRHIEEDVSESKIKISTDTLKTHVQFQKNGVISAHEKVSKKQVEIIDL